MEIRQPIVTVVGHVDHGKTSILDRIRSTSVTTKEAGGITQMISSTMFPAEILETKCKSLLEKYKIKLTIPGFLFIDTPGHAAFTNLRKRGGALADLAILVIDINEGIMQQTAESIEILKSNKTPFIVALNKIDAISGWRRHDETLEKNISVQSDFVKKDFDTKLYKLIASLSTYGFDSDVFYRINDFTKQLALIPCSGKTGEGIPELLVMLAGLSQKFLSDKIVIHSKEAKGNIIEVKREKSTIYLESVLYDGILKINDTIVIAGLEKPVVTKVRSLFEALPLGQGYHAVKQSKAASGVRIQVPEAQEILPGMPFVAVEEKDIEKTAEEIQKEVSESIQTEQEGVIIKADSLGSLEALIMLLNKKNIAVNKVGIGDIGKADIIAAASFIDTLPLNAIVLGFNVNISEEIAEEKNVKILTNPVIYRLLEDFEKWRKNKEIELQNAQLKKITRPCKIKVLRYCFRQSKPAVFGVNVLGGSLKAGIQLINSDGKVIERVKEVQLDGKKTDKAEKGKDVAISLPNITYGRQVNENDIFYSNIKEDEFMKMRENKKLLSPDEITILQEIAQIKRKEKATWGL